MASPRLIVSETTSKWAVALRRQLPSGAFVIRETRSLEDCWQESLDSPASMAVLEVTSSNLDRLAMMLPRHRLTFPHAAVAVVGSRRLAAAEWLMRELGAVHAAFSSRDLGPLIRMIQRHAERCAVEDPSGRSSCLWRQLPWGAVGDAGALLIDPEPAWLMSEPGRPDTPDGA